MPNDSVTSLFASHKAPELFSHQEETQQIGCTQPRVFDMSDAGTGKTRAWLEVLRHRFKVHGGKALIIAPKTILKSAWVEDIRKFTPELTYSVAYAQNRKKAFEADVQIYITNHDAVKWLQKHRKTAIEGRGFHSIIIDESTAFKHRTSQRSKALAKLVDLFQFRTNLTGTPNPNGLLDLWHQVFLLDGGTHLGSSFFRYRAVVCTPKQVGPSPNHLQWRDQEGAAEAVADLLEDITVRHRFEDCTDIPENHEYTVDFELNAQHRQAYETLRQHAILELKEGGITAFNAGVLRNKLLQLASGAVYDDEGIVQLYDTDRYELVLELAEQRPQSIVAFNWRHQRDQLTQLADKRGITHGLIDGTVSAKRRDEIVEQYQAGLLRIIFAHPASAGHGLTLTRGTATIWSSPVYNAEHYVQFNKRIYRIGQRHKTETLIVVAKNTIDVDVAQRLMAKIYKMDDLLEMLT